MTSSEQQYPAEPTLVEYPHPVLRQVAHKVEVFDDALAAFAQNMLSAMKRFKGVGLAAPQVAVSKRLFVTDHARSDETPEPMVWINPRIENPSGTTVYEEGCLSFPEIYAKVERHNAFDFVWQDVEGTEHTRHLDVEAGDFLGIVVQHELDHLDGKVFVDHLTPLQFNMVRRRLKEMEKVYKKATGKVGSVIRR